MNLKKSRRVQDIGCILIILLICIGLIYKFLDLSNMNINIPIGYADTDAIFTAYNVKTIQDFGWYSINPNVGAPHGSNMYDFPSNTDNFNFLILKILIAISGSYGAAMNLFFLGMFPITAIISYIVMQRLKINRIVSILGSLSFTFLSYRFIRGENHLFLTAYYLIPLIVLIIIWLAQDEDYMSIKKDFWRNKKNLVTLLLIPIIALSGIYYAFFMCFFICIVIMIKLFKEPKNFRTLLRGGGIITGIVIVIILSMLPTIYYNKTIGPNLESPARDPIEAEIYAMKITQLYAPKETRIPGLAEKFNLYHYYAPMPNEGTEYLGIAGLIGFTILLAFLFRKKEEDDYSLKTVETLSQLNIAGVLLATIGGIGSIFALLISPQIRAYNRISVYIAYFSILGICLMCTLALEKLKFKKIILLGICGVFCFSIWDQMPINPPDFNYINGDYMIDERFIDKIESQVSDGAMIFQLPYFKFPESPPQNNMKDYSLFRGYLHSDNLKWSYGGFKGRDSDLWNRYITSLEIEEMIRSISLTGFEGIYIDRTAYLDDEIAVLEKKLEEILGSAPFKSENNRLAFFDMKSFNENLRNEYTVSQLETMKDNILYTILKLGEGIYPIEGQLDQKWMWSSQESYINLINLKDEHNEVTLKFNVYSGHDETSTLKIKMDDIEKNFLMTNKGIEIILDINLAPGDNIISFETDAVQVEAPTDSRDLYFRIEDISIK